MAKARRGGQLSAGEVAQLTSGQVAKLRSENRFQAKPSYIGNMVGDLNLPYDPVAPGGKPSYVGNMVGDLNLPPSYGNIVQGIIDGKTPPPAQSGGGGGGGGDKPPAFDGYTPDSFYNDALAQIAANRQRALDATTEGERGLANDYGLGITQDADGAKFTGTWAASDANQGGIDPSNPFSRASLLNRSYFTAGRVGEGSYANRGLLTSGAYQRSQARDTFRFEGGKDSLLKSFASSLQDYRQRRAQAEADARASQQQASYDLFQRNRDNYDRMYGLNG